MPEKFKLKTPLILTLDIGTSSTRTMLFDAAARPVPGCVAQQPYRVRTTPDGGAEFDTADLLDAAVGAIDEILAQAGSRAAQIGGVAVDTMVTNVLGVDAAGAPVTPVLTYADTRSSAQAQALRAELGRLGVAEAHNRTGTLVHASYLPPRFRWMAQHHPEWLGAAAHWVSVGELLLWQFFGDWRVSVSAASWTGLLNRHNLTWDETWLAKLPLSAEQLSPLCDVRDSLRGLRPDWAARWPALAAVPWFPAIGDGAAANIGSGAGDPSRLALTIGTSGAMRAVLPAANVSAVPDGLWFYRVDRRRGLLGGATTEGGSLFAWFNDTLNLPPPAELERQLAHITPAAHGLTILPFVSGERAPGWHDFARASVVGFTLNTRPVDVVRAGLESIALRFALIYQRIAPHLPPAPNRQIVAAGGLLNSATWLQMFADALGQPVTPLAEKEATSRGAALLALESLGVIGDVTDLPPAFGATLHPIPEHQPRYRAALERQLEIYNLLIESQEPAG